MRIYIPSRGRVNTTRTYKNLPPELQKIALYVVPKDELKTYVAAGFPAVSPPPSVNRIAITRQWIVEYHLKTYGHVTDKFIMLDDDLSFRAYNPDIVSKYGASNDAAILRAFRRLAKELDTHAHGGILMQLGSNRHEEAPEPKYNTRACRAIAYRASILKQHWPHTKFGAVPVQDDFHATLTLLKLGYPNVVVAEIAQDQPEGSGADGGAADYRDMKYHADSVHRLKQLHPEFVRVVEKKTEKSWKGEARIDVVVSWKKALEYGIATHGVRKLKRSP